MEDDEFVERIHRKIERMTQRAVEVQVDREELNQLQVDLHREVPLVVVGSNVLRYSGFARMCIEYAVESIKQQRTIDTLEFHLLAGPQLSVPDSAADSFLPEPAR